VPAAKASPSRRRDELLLDGEAVEGRRGGERSELAVDGLVDPRLEITGIMRPDTARIA